MKKLNLTAGSRITKAQAFNHGYCVPGCRLFFKRNNLDYRDFIRNGISVETLLKLDDHMANELIERVYGVE